MVKALLLSACACITVVCSAAAHPQKAEAIFANRDSRTFDLELFDSGGELVVSTTLSPGEVHTLVVTDGEARIYRPSKRLSFGTPLSRCKILASRAKDLSTKLQFQIRDGKIAELKPRP